MNNSKFKWPKEDLLFLKKIEGSLARLSLNYAFPKENVETKGVIEEMGRRTGGAWVVSFSDEIMELDMPEYKYLPVETQMRAKALTQRLRELEQGPNPDEHEAWDRPEVHSLEFRDEEKARREAVGVSGQTASRKTRRATTSRAKKRTKP